MLRRLAAKTIELGGPTVDFDEVCEELDFEAPDAAPYLWSDGEIAATVQRLQMWRAASTTALRSSTQPHARQIGAAEIALLLSHRLGLRRGEVEALRFVDVVPQDNSWLLYVRPTRYHRPKSDNAIRHFELQEWLGEEQLSTFIDFVAGQRSQFSGEPPREARILDLSWLPHDSLPDCGPADVVTAACRGIMDASAIRFHAGRHTLANRLLRTLLPAHLAWADCQAALPKIDALTNGSLAFRCLVFSRALGHGHPRTTLENYVHLVAHLPRSAHGFDPVRVEEAARLTGIAESTLRERAQAAGHVLSTGDMAELLDALSSFRADHAETAPVNALLPPRDPVGAPLASIVVFADIVRELAQMQLTDREIELRRGMRSGEAGILRSLIGSVARRHRYNLFGTTNDAGDDAYVRVPRIRQAREVLGRLEQLEAQRPELINALRLAAEVQARFDGALWSSIPGLLATLQTVMSAIAPEGWTVAHYREDGMDKLMWARPRLNGPAGPHETSAMNFLLLVISSLEAVQRFWRLQGGGRLGP